MSEHLFLGDTTYPHTPVIKDIKNKSIISAFDQYFYALQNTNEAGSDEYLLCKRIKPILESIWDVALSQQPSTDALQCKIDNLMLEYCPDEMTKEQIENWGKHQVPSKNSDIEITISGISHQPPS